MKTTGPLKIQIDSRELDAATTRALEICARHRELVKDMRGFLGTQFDDFREGDLIDQVRDKASKAIIDETVKALKEKKSF